MSVPHYHAAPACDGPTQHDSCAGLGELTGCQIVETYPEEICACYHESQAVAAAENSSEQKEIETTA